ncbi:MAG: SoxR reducing system RseC family protein [Spirochaetales bacterium]|jgi:positive regulator of sigma E activity|nr:SoxR reducing system RseC family protein [Spirochaetales bacterium]
MIETGTVKAIEGRRITLACGDPLGCGKCPGKLFCSVNERRFEAENDRDLSLAVGDRVRIFLPPGLTVLSAFLTLILPLLLFILFYLGAEKLAGLKGELSRLGSGFAGLGLGFITALRLGRSRFLGRLPQVVEKVSGGV